MDRDIYCRAIAKGVRQCQDGGGQTDDDKRPRDDADDDARHRTNVVRTISTLSGVETSLLHSFGAVDSAECPFCKKVVCNMHHLIWH